MEKIKLKELLGSLQTYELDLKVPNKKKGLPLTSTYKEENEDREEDSDDDVAYLSKKFNRFLKNKNYIKNSEDKKNAKLKKNLKGSSFKKDVQCYNCKGFGNIATNCPTLREQDKRDKKGKKVLNITWDDDDDDISENEESYVEVDNDNSSSWPLLTTAEDNDNEADESQVENEIDEEEEEAIIDVNEVQHDHSC